MAMVAEAGEPARHLTSPRLVNNPGLYHKDLSQKGPDTVGEVGSSGERGEA
jgi:hypothetical protein